MAKINPYLAMHTFGAISSKLRLRLSAKARILGPLGQMTGVQLMTGAPTYRRTPPLYLHLVDVDIEQHLIATYPEIVDRISRAL